MMSTARVLSTLIAAIVCCSTVSQSSPAQGLGAIRRKAEEAKKKLEDSKKAASDSAKQKAADSTRVADSTKSANAKAAPAAGATTSAGQPNAPAKADPKVWDNYDFVPGNKVIFYTDFSEDRVGNFARGLKHAGGPIEIVERDGVKMLRSTGRSTILIPVGKKLPQRFTLEIDVMAPTADCCGYDVIAFEGGAELDRGDKSVEINWHPNGTMLISSSLRGDRSVKHPEPLRDQLKGNVAHVRVLMDSGYFKMYTNERRNYNMPELEFKRDSVIRVFVNGTEEPDVAVYLTSIRVAESETDVLYDALLSKGRWVTQGILFATGKTDLQPESRPVLKEIASTMQKYADLKILIEGHTDNVGSAASNLTLSDGRAAAVKAALVTEFGIDGGRITTKGLGDTKPAVPNATAVGRAQNRRVEIVKQ
jgi:outer membrane protein OmpA-like peptidoglycan-associated protein